MKRRMNFNSHNFLNHLRAPLCLLVVFLVLSFASQAFAVSIPAGGALKPDGTRLYVPDQASGYIYIYNTSNGNKVRSINVWGYPFGMTISPDGNWLYASVGGAAPSLQVFNIGTGDPTGPAATLYLYSDSLPRAIAISPSGNRLFIADSKRRVIMVNVTNPLTPGHLGDITTEGGGAQLPFGIYGLAIRPDGNRLYVSHKDPAGHIYVYNISGATPSHVATYSAGLVHPTYLVVNNSGTTLLARVSKSTSPFTDVKIYDCSGSGLSHLVDVSVPSAGNEVDPNNSDAAESLSISPDGQQFYVSHYRTSNGKVHTYGFSMSSLGNVWEVAGNDSSKDFSILAPGGGWIYLTYSNGGTYVAHPTSAPSPTPTIDHFEDPSAQVITEAFVYDTVRIVGSGFGADPGAGNRSTAQNHVNLAGMQLPDSQIYYWSATVIEIGIPLDIAGSLVVAGPRNIRVTAGGQNSNTVPITIRPRIYSLTPNSGPIGTTVTIGGTAYGNSSAGNTVTFNGTPVTNIVSWSNTQIVVTVPNGATTGPVVVTVNGAVSNNDVIFTIGDGATIDHFEDSFGQVTTWAYVYDTVTIVGSGFGADPGNGNRDTALENILLSGLIVPDNNPDSGIEVYSWSDTRIDFGIPLDIGGTITLAGPNSVQVTNDGTAGNTMSLEIRPRIYGLTPNSGPIGTTVTIDGTAFGNTRGTSTITFNGTPVTNYVSWSNTQVVVTVPNGATTGPVVATVNAAVSNNDQIFTVTFLPTPNITHFENPSLEITTEAYVYDTIRIVGSNFGADPGPGSRSTASNHVTLGGVQLPDAQIYYWSDTVVEIGIPLNVGATLTAAGPNAVQVTAGGVAGNSMSLLIRPRIYSLTPNSGPIGTSVTIGGTAYGTVRGSSIVTFNGTPVTNYVSWSNTSITVLVPAGATTGPVVVTVNSAPSNNDQIFTVIPGATLLYLSPDNGNRGETLNIKIVGSNTNFDGSTTVDFGAGITVNYLNVIDATHAVANITINVAAALGARTVTVTTGAEIVTGTFTVNPVGTPMVLFIVPDNGNQGETLNVKIVGSNTSFTGSPAVSFTNPGITVNSSQAISATEVVANISIAGGAAVGECDVTVAGMTLNNGFTVNPAGTAMILYAVPDNGDQGTTALNVHIFGSNTNFTAGPSVVFTGTGITVNYATTISPTEIVANINIAAGAAIGYRSIIINGNLALVNGFRVNPISTATLLYITPDNADRGDTLTARIVGLGTSFDGTTTVTFSNPGIIVNSVNVLDATNINVSISINVAAPIGFCNVTATNLGTPLTLVDGFLVNPLGTPELLTIVPSTGMQGAVGLVVTVTGLNTSFQAGVTQLMFTGTGITVNSITVDGPTQFTANLNISAAAPLGPRDVIVTTNTQVISLANGFTVVLQDVTPPSQILDLVATKVGADVQLDWSLATDNVAVLGYRVYHSTGPNGPWGQLNGDLPATATSYLHTGAGADASNHYYYVVAFDAAQEALRSNIASIIKMTYPVGQNRLWVSVPYLTNYSTASDILGELPMDVTYISRFNPVTQAWETLTRAGSPGDVNFAIIPGEGYEIFVDSATGGVIAFAGSHELGFTFTLTNVGTHLISIPYNATYTDAQSIVNSINGAAQPGTCVLIKRLNPTTQLIESLTWVPLPIGGGIWMGGFNFVPGEAYQIAITAQTVWQPAVY